MSLQDKDILITPNKGASADPKIEFKGADASTGPQTITLNVYPTNGGTVSFEGSAGQLFSIANTMTGTIYSVNDVSGIPSIEVLDTGVVKLAQYNGNVLVGTGTDDGINKVQINGSLAASTLSIKAYNETYTTISISSNTLTIDLSAGTLFKVNLNSNINNINIINAIPSKTSSFSIIFTGMGTSYTVNWGSIKWPDSLSPTLTTINTKIDVLTFVTTDGGTTWLGFVSGQNF